MGAITIIMRVLLINVFRELCNAPYRAPWQSSQDPTPRAPHSSLTSSGAFLPFVCWKLFGSPSDVPLTKRDFCPMFAASHQQCFRAVIAKVAVRNQRKTTCICDDYLVLQRPSFYLSHLNLSIRPKGESQIYTCNYTFAEAFFFPSQWCLVFLFYFSGDVIYVSLVFLHDLIT